MGKFTQTQYKYALERIEDLLPLVSEETDPNSKEALELSLMSDVVIEYENEHFPIDKPSPAELIGLALEEKQMSQKALAETIGVSPSRINDYVKGKSEPTLRIASRLCKALDITPAAMMGL
ncbi:MAG: helix-turn-helix transcriptional regulator [Bacteroidales bacterium]|nr:helix-turn-helix transcriptional regulator [Bacteroidales bacterium]